MKLKQYLKEEFHNFYKIARNKKTVAVYKNSGISEIRDMIKEINSFVDVRDVKFIADFNKKQYFVFDGENFWHDDICTALNIDYYDDENYYFGTATYIPGEQKLKNFKSCGPSGQNLYKKDWTFLEKILSKDEITKYKKRFFEN